MKQQQIKKLSKKEIEKQKIAEEKNAINSMYQVIDKNKRYIELKESVKNKTVSQETLKTIYFDLEHYFKGEMPSLELYSGDYAGELLELLFDNYPEMFSRDRYVNKSRRAFKNIISAAYQAVFANLKVGEVRPNQVVDFLKYIQPFLVKEGENEDKTSKLLFSVKVGDERK